MIRHSLLMSLSVASLLLGLSACTPDAPKKTPAPAQVEATTKAPRLGDPLTEWIQKEGTPTEEKEYLKTFRNGAMSVIVMENHVVNITFTKKEGFPIPDATAYLPKDSTLIQKKEDEDAHFTYHSEYYQSKSLQEAVPLTDGAFSIVTTKEKKSGTLSSLVIDSSPLSQL